MAGMQDIIARIDALLANTPQSEIEEFEVTRCLRDCRDEIIAARACAEMMLQGTGQRLAEGMAERVINGQTVGAWIPVSERLPEKNEPVCVVCGGKVTVGTYSPMMDDWWALVLPVTGIQPTDSVTHWMPLPEPPEVK
jgi:hypothetical protein